MCSRTDSPGSGPARLLFATTSAGKLAEGRALLATLELTVLGLADLGLDGEVVEDAADYAGNARKKALYWARRSGLATLADDSGLEVEALAGAPGVLSARFGGPGLDDAGRNRLLLERLAGVPPSRRGARFVCVLVFVAADGRELLTVEGERQGTIATAERGRGGFGYDPLFEPEPGGPTFAEMDARAKSRQSHRGHAFRRLAEALGARGGELRAWLCAGEGGPRV